MTDDIIILKEMNERFQNLERNLYELSENVKSLHVKNNALSNRIAYLNGVIEKMKNHLDGECTHQNRFGDSCQDCGKFLA